MTPLSGAVNSAGAALEKLLVDPAGSRLIIGVPGGRRCVGIALTAKIPLASDGRCRPLAFILTPGQVEGAPACELVMAKIRVPGSADGHGSGPAPSWPARRIRPARSVTACATAGSGQSSRSRPTRSRPADDGAVPDAAHSPSSMPRPPPSIKRHSASQPPISGPHGDPKEMAWFRHPAEGRARVEGALSLRLAGRPYWVSRSRIANRWLKPRRPRLVRAGPARLRGRSWRGRAE